MTTVGRRPVSGWEILLLRSAYGCVNVAGWVYGQVQTVLVRRHFRHVYAFLRISRSRCHHWFVGCELSDLDIDRIGRSPADGCNTTVPRYHGVGVYMEHFTYNAHVHNFRIGQDVGLGFNSEVRHCRFELLQTPVSTNFFSLAAIYVGS